MDNSFPKLIDSATSILIVLPTKPYFDQVAAGLALYLSIHDKKEASIYCPSPMMVGFGRLIGVNKVTTELGNKNLNIKFAGYEANNIDKVSYDIEGGEFNLTVVPKAGAQAPQKEQIVFGYSGVSADLIILVGGANDSHFPILESQELAGAKVAHIGNRVLESKREVMSFAKPGAAASEVVASLIKENGLAIDPDIATNLVMGIEDGSSNFQSGEVAPETFEVTAYLLRSGGQRMPKVKLSPANFPPGAIPGVPIPREPVTPISQVETQAETPQAEAGGENPDVNPPADWLQPKIFKGSANQPDSFSENKG
jgi:hypothetical protein